MKITLLTPTYWPEVRRGTERLVHDLGVALTRRDHEVTIICSAQIGQPASFEDGMTVVRCGRLPRPGAMSTYEDHLESLPALALELRRRPTDVIHAFFPSYAWLATKLGMGDKLIFSVHGIPTRTYLVSRRRRIEMLKSIIDSAAAVSVLSQAAADAFERYLLHKPVILSGGVDVGGFGVAKRRTAQPTIICAANPADPRKRIDLLVAAYVNLREQRPDAELLLVGGNGPDRSDQLPPGVSALSIETTSELANRYSSAWISALTSLDEAFGLVLIESLAAGTPVVAADSGACSEIVSSPGVGRLFSPESDPSEVAGALAEGLVLSERAETESLCRDRAAEFAWDQVVLEHENLYDSISEA